MLASLPTDKIIPGNNDREQFDPIALQELADSIKAIGQLQPGVVRPVGDGTYQIVNGERRWRACKLAGLPYACVIREDMSDGDAMIAMTVENMHRRDLNPIEEAMTIAKHRAAGRSDDDIRAVMGYRYRSMVDSRASLLSIREDLQGMVRNGTLTVGYAQTLAAHNLDPNRQLIAIRKLQANPGFGVEWFGKVCAELAAEQATEPAGFMFEMAAYDVDRPADKVKLPPHPRKDKAPVVGPDIKAILANQIEYWIDAKDSWAAMGGRSREISDCEIKIMSLESTLDLIAAASSATATETAPAPAPIPVSNILSTEQAAGYVGLSISAIKFHVRKGNLVKTMIGKNLVFTRSELDRFAAIERKPGNPNWIAN